MTNYENLKAAAQSLGDFCDNHEDCDGCTLNKEKSGGKK